MTKYPAQYDTDTEIPVIDDNVTEWSGEPFNKAREAILALQKTLGINPQGLAGTVANRIDVSLDENGNLRASAIAAIGLLTNITDSQIDLGANINEQKLNLAYKTYDLHTLIVALSSTVSAINTFAAEIFQDIFDHLSGAVTLPSGFAGRHVASHIDLDDPLLDKDGVIRAATQVMQALSGINEELVNHQTLLFDQHPATAISVNTDSFAVIPKTKDDVQKSLEFIDSMGETIYGEFGAILNSNGIVRVASTEDLNSSDGYSTVLLTEALPVETIINATENDIVKFFVSPAVTANQLDALFASISVGDYITINYGGYISTFTINSVLFDPQISWEIKIDGVNLEAKNTLSPAFAYIEQKKYDDNVFGNLAVCPANHDLQPTYDHIPHSVIVVPPRSAQVLGMDLNLTDLDSTHYNLYLDFYPNGTPSKMIALPAIDVTGNQGATPGQYTLEDIIRNTNNGFRTAGFNYRMVAFERLGQFGLAIADHYGNPGFSIRSGEMSSGVLIEDLPNNIIGNNRHNPPTTTDLKDALGLGNQKANVASPIYSTTQASVPTRIFVGKKNKKFNVFGKLTDLLAADPTTNNDGYWQAIVESQNQISSVTIETTYLISQGIIGSNLKPGSTIVVLPEIELTDLRYNDYDYGRFFVKEIDGYSYCEFDGYDCITHYLTRITVINGIAIQGLPDNNQTPINLPVHIYHCDDSVTFDVRGVADLGPTTNTKRLYEIFINTQGQTLAYERIRLPITNGELGYVTPSRSFGWHIINVSPKFKGYVDSTQQNRRFVKLAITDYNTTDKSFKAQLSEDALITQKIGPIAIGRRDEIVRVYDHTGVDYIDLIFDDQFEDYTIINEEIVFEVFLTESLNEEFLCVGSCCQLFIPLTINGGPISFIKDRRGFGTISERVLSDSAIKFIETNNRLLHENSIINGFEFISQSEGVLYFTGGTANINGKIINKNAISFTIFPIALDAILDTAVDIALCLDENGNVWWAPLTTDGSFNVLEPYVDFSIPSTTSLKAYPFEYIVNNRKDLVPFSVVSLISKIDVTVPALLSASPTDSRKFLREAQPNVVSVTGEVLGDENYSQITGNFASLSAAVEYAYLSRMSKPKIVIKGTIVLDSIIELSDVIIEGGPYNLVRVLNVDSALSVFGNTKISGVNFQREFNGEGSSYIDEPGKGTILINCVDQNTYADIIIENCKFSTKDGFTAPWIPHILADQDGGGAVIKNVTINNNTFHEDFAQGIIAFISRNGNSDYGTVLNGVTLKENKANHLSAITFTSDANDINEYVGLEAYNLKIENNMFGNLMLNLSRHSWLGTDSGFDGNENSYFSANPIDKDYAFSSIDPVNFNNFYTMNPNVKIIHNTFLRLLAMNLAGEDIFDSFCVFPSPSYLITGNNCSSLNVCVNGYKADSNKGAGFCIINNNNLTATSNVDNTRGIFITGSLKYDSYDLVAVNIHNNIFSSSGGVYKYNYAIKSDVSNNIHNNIIKDCFTVCGIFDNFLYSNETNKTISSIHKNIINRGSENIYCYIQVEYNQSIKTVQITENIFDQATIDGISTEVIRLDHDDLDTKLTCRKKIKTVRNINQTFELDLMSYTESNLIFESSLIGWVHRSLVMVPPMYMVSDGTYYLQELIINLPFIEDALAVELNLTIYARMISATPVTLYLKANGATGEEGVRVIDPDINIFPISPSDFDVNSTPSITNISISLQDLQIGPTAYEQYTTRKSIPVNLGFLQENVDPFSPFPLEKSSPFYDVINVQKILATYRY